MQNYTLVLTTGAPGSCWSMISNRFKRSMRGFDKSDEQFDRKYKMPEEHVSQNYNITDPNWKQTTHNGSYFGPHHEFGHGFDDIAANYTKESFVNECLKPYSDSDFPNKLIRSHWFAYNLDWLWENCKGHKMLLIWRDPKAAENWWYSMGGWNIQYPVYTWYENPNRMAEKIKEENDLILKFAEKHNIDWWDYDLDGEWIRSRFPEAVAIESKANPIINDTIKVRYLDII